MTVQELMDLRISQSAVARTVNSEELDFAELAGKVFTQEELLKLRSRDSQAEVRASMS